MKLCEKLFGGRLFGEIVRANEYDNPLYVITPLGLSERGSEVTNSSSWHRPDMGPSCPVKSLSVDVLYIGVTNNEVRDFAWSGEVNVEL